MRLLHPHRPFRADFAVHIADIVAGTAVDIAEADIHAFPTAASVSCLDAGHLVSNGQQSGRNLGLPESGFALALAVQ